MDFSEIIEKIKDILSNDKKNKKVYDKDVAIALGLSKESLSHLKRKNSIPYEQIAKFCAQRKISINWILFEQLPKSLEEETEKYVKIKYFSKLGASAGGGGFCDDSGYEYLSIDGVFLDSLYKSNISNPKNISAMNVMGDSMYPSLQDKEIILFDTSIKDTKKDGIYIISTNAGLFVKRVSARLDGSLELISDNKNYNSEIINTDEIDSIDIIGKVIGKLALV
jgi:phage repressor protein C with HTH and peptisase S24 domain/DNA-binding Xre family transcriptional regulator